MSQIGTKIDEALTAKGWDLNELSYRTRTPWVTLNNWRRGTRKPSDLAVLKRVADELEIPLEELIETELSETSA